MRLFEIFIRGVSLASALTFSLPFLTLESFSQQLFFIPNFYSYIDSISSSILRLLGQFQTFYFFLR